MLRALMFGCVFCSAASVMAQSNASANYQHADESAESAWLEMMPALTPPPMHSVAPTPAPPQDAGRAVRISGGVMAGQVRTQVPPQYPKEARANHLEGTVVLSGKIGTDGTVQELEAISGPEPLRGSALVAVRQWTYKPYFLNGTPVTVLTTMTVNYHLNAGPAGR
ncbi:MAG: energy transducer TonB [Janthinobacterium lividum]